MAVKRKKKVEKNTKKEKKDGYVTQWSDRGCSSA